MRPQNTKHKFFHKIKTPQDSTVLLPLIYKNTFLALNKFAGFDIGLSRTNTSPLKRNTSNKPHTLNLESKVLPYKGSQNTNSSFKEGNVSAKLIQDCKILLHPLVLHNSPPSPLCGSTIEFGTYALQSIDNGILQSCQIESIIKMAKKKLKKKGKI